MPRPMTITEKIFAAHAGLDEVKAALEAAGLTITGCNQMDDWCQLSATC